jgi:hypothetical protein
VAKSGPQRTFVAMQGFGLSARFDEHFAQDRISGFSPRLVEPAGVSTEGGKQALQHVTLQPGSPQSPVLTVGWVNCANNQARLRTCGCMQLIFARRFPGRQIVLDPLAYQHFLDRAAAFLQSQGMQVGPEHVPPEGGGATGSVPASRSSIWLWVVLCVLGLAIGILLILGLSGRLPPLRLP